VPAVIGPLLGLDDVGHDLHDILCTLIARLALLLLVAGAATAIAEGALPAAALTGVLEDGLEIKLRCVGIPRELEQEVVDVVHLKALEGVEALLGADLHRAGVSHLPGVLEEIALLAGLLEELLHHLECIEVLGGEGDQLVLVETDRIDVVGPHRLEVRAGDLGHELHCVFEPCVLELDRQGSRKLEQRVALGVRGDNHHGLRSGARLGGSDLCQRRGRSTNHGEHNEHIPNTGRLHITAP
jgi:hypothetical protein